MAHDIVFRDATVIDGTGSVPFTADVAVDHDRISEIGTVSQHGDREIDASALVLAPGFIDVHTHDDFALLSQPDMSFKTLQGVTTVVTGNCGTSAVPFGEWLGKIEYASPAVNVVPLLGHGSVRERVMGRDNTSAAGPQELTGMIALVEQALDAGAAGISTGLVYVPGAFSTREEVVEMVRPVAERLGIYTSHIRNEADGLVASINEAIDVGRSTGVKVQISHLKAIGAENFGNIAGAIESIVQARQEGLDVMADQYPYSRGSTQLRQLVMRGAFDGPSPFGYVQGEDVFIASAPHSPHWEGRTLDDIAASLGKPVPDAARHVLEVEKDACMVVYQNQSDGNIETVMRQEFVMIGSDGVPAGARPHPRLHHTFPRVLGEYSRDRGVIPMQVAVHKMTGMCAARFGLHDRGTIRAGNFADLVLFDASTIKDTGSYEEPTTVPLGIAETWVNGRSVGRAGSPTAERPGRVLRTLGQ